MSKIAVENISFSYTDGNYQKNIALENINLEFPMGKLTAIIGATGSGKSTLLKHLIALLKIQQGTVTILDLVLNNKTKNKVIYELRKTINILSQFSEDQLFEDSARDDILFALKNFNLDDQENRLILACRRANFPLELLDKSFLELSGGQRRKLALACLLALDTEIILLDEPTSSLDPSSAKTVMELFKELKHKYHKTIIMISHDLEMVQKYADFIVYMVDGKVKYFGLRTEFFKLTDHQLDLPQFIKFRNLLSQKLNQELISSDLSSLKQELKL